MLSLQEGVPFQGPRVGSCLTLRKMNCQRRHTCWHIYRLYWEGASLVAQRLKRLPAMQETWVRSLGQEDPLEKEMATHSSILAWRIPRTEEPGGLQSTGSQRVRHDRATFTFSLHFVWNISLYCLVSLWLRVLGSTASLMGPCRTLQGLSEAAALSEL